MHEVVEKGAKWQTGRWQWVGGLARTTNGAEGVDALLQTAGSLGSPSCVHVEYAQLILDIPNALREHPVRCTNIIIVSFPGLSCYKASELLSIPEIIRRCEGIWGDVEAGALVVDEGQLEVGFGVERKGLAELG